MGISINSPIISGELGDWNVIAIRECNEELVSLRGIHNRIIVEPQYFINNIPGALNDCLVRKTVAKKLVKAAEELPGNFSLVIWDGWRPTEVQTALFDEYKSRLKQQFSGKKEEDLDREVAKFVSVPSVNPLCPSPHLTGGAVDLSIMKGSSYVPMGTGFDDFSPLSNTNYYEILSKRKELTREENEFLQDRRLLFHCMRDAGFTNFPNEWWHFDYGDQFWASISKSDHAIYGKAQRQ
ncbi:MAG: M15 family metallopeptidase [Leptolinea sp.]|jgi:D-alanyl-D-alanine dipeptidase|nr:M15 family metallopeptidase [Leptolinea sp.]